MLAGKKVLITGLTGRIGQAVAARFAPVCDLWGLARYGREGSLDEAVRLGVRPVRGDFARGSLDDVPRDFDYVLNIAANVYPQTAEDGMVDNSDGVVRLMQHCRDAKAFLQVSTSGVYMPKPDPYHLYAEDADLGCCRDQYEPSKLAGEGAARGASIILGLPTVICRQNVQYGSGHVKPSSIDRSLDSLVRTGEVRVQNRPFVLAPIHEHNICDLIEPSLGIASTPASIINWGGDDAVEWREIFEYAGRLIGRPPTFVFDPTFTTPCTTTDPAKRRAIAGPLSIGWREGIRRTLRLRHPQLALRDID